MTKIDVNTSPLQAAREWRGVSMVAAALQAGLTAGQVEALESGDSESFGSIEEMVATAVVYGASLGIGRDEALALLDRTMLAYDVEVSFPDASNEPLAGVANGAFSNAVKHRTEAMAIRNDEASLVLEPLDAPAMPADIQVEFPTVPTPEQAVESSQEIDAVHPFADVDTASEADSPSIEIDTEWEHFDDYENSFDEHSIAGQSRIAAIRASIADKTRSGFERVVGTDRTDAIAQSMRRASQRAAVAIKAGRERLRESEHATLIVAIGAGAVLIAMIIAIGGALGNRDGETTPLDKPKSEIAAKQELATDNGSAADESGDAAAPTTQKPMIAPAKLRVNIYNAGSKKGYAKEVADKLKAKGYRIAAVENAGPSFNTASVIHPKGMQREARLLARHLGIGTLQVAPGTTRAMTVIVK